MYRYRDDIEIDDLLDGRTIMYVSKMVNIHRERLSKVLRGLATVREDEAIFIVDKLKPGSSVSNYFKKIEREG